jgi:hypothetical protein
VSSTRRAALAWSPAALSAWPTESCSSAREPVAEGEVGGPRLGRRHPVLGRRAEQQRRPPCQQRAAAGRASCERDEQHGARDRREREYPGLVEKAGQAYPVGQAHAVGAQGRDEGQQDQHGRERRHRERHGRDDPTGRQVQREPCRGAALLAHRPGGPEGEPAGLDTAQPAHRPGLQGPGRREQRGDGGERQTEGEGAELQGQGALGVVDADDRADDEGADQHVRHGERAAEDQVDPP